MRILVVEDELSMRMALTEALRSENYHVTTASDGEEALEIALASDFAMILLDIMMPKINGLSVCKELRKRGKKTPVLMLTARARVEDCVAGLDSGADDYLIKPFSLRELLARVRVHTRKTSQPPVADTIIIGEVTIDFHRQLCEINNETIGLNTKECGILRLLAERQGGVVTRDEFLDQVWGYHASPTTRTVDNFIKELRKKLGKTGKSHLITVRGRGYRLKIASKPL